MVPFLWTYFHVSTICSACALLGFYNIWIIPLLFFIFFENTNFKETKGWWNLAPPSRGSQIILIMLSFSRRIEMSNWLRNLTYFFCLFVKALMMSNRRSKWMKSSETASVYLTSLSKFQTTYFTRFCIGNLRL